MDADEMTDAKRGAEDVAAEICRDILVSWRCYSHIDKPLVTVLREALTQYADARVKEAHDNGREEMLIESNESWGKRINRRIDEEIAKARNEALEQAADICDQESTIEGIAQKCAERIRTLKTGGKAT